jgi:hypothetical protein
VEIFQTFLNETNTADAEYDNACNVRLILRELLKFTIPNGFIETVKKNLNNPNLVSKSLKLCWGEQNKGNNHNLS